jgi:5-formyltetrahydrofolate cyclo-ligase
LYAATSITKKVLSLDQYKRARSISIFLSMPGKEISTTELVLDALRGGKNVFVPYIHSGKKSASKSMAMLRIQDDEDLSSLEPDPWGIPSLSQDSVSSRQNALGGYGISDGGRETQDPQLDLIFMPAVAFDRSRHRLGHGKGFYDRYLQRYQDVARASGSPMPLLGWCLDVSIAV